MMTSKRASTVYVVEDEPEILDALEDISRQEGFETTGFSNAEDCLDAMEDKPCDILVTDLKLPGIDGVELTRRTSASSSDTSIIIITAYGNLSSALSALDHGAEDYIIKPFNVDSIRHALGKIDKKRRLVRENKQYREKLEEELDRRQNQIVTIGRQLEETFFKTVQLLGNAQESRETFLLGRTERITIYAIQTARRLNWSEEEIVKIAITAPISDVGKISISDEILNKSEPLTEEEVRIIRDHVYNGEQIIKSLPHYQDVGAIIRYHHERLDGSGYPEGIKGSQIPETALLIGLCDTFDAMTHDRPWRERYSVEHCLDYLRSQAGVTFDAAMVEAFISFFSEENGAELVDQKPVERFFEDTFPLLEKINI